MMAPAQDPFSGGTSGLSAAHAACSLRSSANQLTSLGEEQCEAYMLDQGQGYRSSIAARPAHQCLRGRQYPIPAKIKRRDAMLPFSNKILSSREFL